MRWMNLSPKRAMVFSMRRMSMMSLPMPMIIARLLPLASPPVMDQRADFGVVDLAHRGHLLLGESGQVAGRNVALGLAHVLRAGNSDRDGVVHQDPAERHGRHRRAAG